MSFLHISVSFVHVIAILLENKRKRDGKSAALSRFPAKLELIFKLTVYSCIPINFYIRSDPMSGNKKQSYPRKSIGVRVRYVAAFLFTLIIATAAVFAFSGNYAEEDYGDNLYMEATITRGQSIEDILPDEPEDAGFRFSHWSLTANGEPFDFVREVYEDTTFYAIWVVDSAYTYGIEDNYGYYEHGGYIAGGPYYRYADVHAEYGNAYVRHSRDAYVSGYAYGNNVYSYAGNNHDYVYDNDLQHNDNYPYENDYIEEDTIIIRFLWNHGRQWIEGADEAPGDVDSSVETNDTSNEADYMDTDESASDDSAEGNSEASNNDADDAFYNDLGGVIGEAPIAAFSIYSDARGNITLDSAVAHIVILDGDYIHVRFPWALDFNLINVNIPEAWSYEVNHRVEKNETYSEDIHGSEGIGGDADRAAHEMGQTYTLVTISHDILSSVSQFAGIVPFGAGWPSEFTAETLAFPYDNGAWLDALGTNTANNHRVVFVPQDVYLNAQLNISGNRHVIIASYGTNLNNNLINHSAPPTTFVINQTSTARHIVTATAGNIVTLSHIILCGGNVFPATTVGGGITVPNNAHLHMLAGSVIRHSRAANGGAVSLAGAGGEFTMRGNASITGNSASTAGGGLHLNGARQSTMFDNSSITGNNAPNGAGVVISAASSGGNPQLTLTGNASITGNTAATSGGGVALTANGARLTMNSGRISGNFANGTAAAAGGGAVAITAGTAATNSVFTMNGGSIYGNHANANAGGVLLAAAGARFFMENSTIGGVRPSGLLVEDPNPYSNTANTSGGGVALVTAGARFYMENGSIVGNISNGTTAAQGGGGVAVTAGTAATNSVFTMNGGNISGNTANQGGGIFLNAVGAFLNMSSGIIGGAGVGAGNHANTNGGGVFASVFTHSTYLPDGSYPQLDIAAAVSFSGNTAGNGSAIPPGNALTATGIQTTQASGAFTHPLNNYDINFINDGSEWFLLHSVVSALPQAEHIVIHPAGTTGVTAGLTGNMYNLIISPGNGSTIIAGPIAGAPAADSHRINVLRDITIAAAQNANIEIILTATTPANIGRHFLVGANGHLTLGGGPLSGNLTLDGGVAIGLTGNRGGVHVNAATGHFTLQQGGAIINSRAATGGGVLIGTSGAGFTMTGGRIADNAVVGTAVGNSGGGVALHATNTTFNMSGGSITGNTVASTNANSGGGGVALTSSSTGARFTMTNGTISGNTAQHGGGVLLHPNNVLYPHIISGGYIYDNLARGSGGGVALHGALTTLNMSGGTIGSTVDIENNHANTSGGGVSVVSTSVFNLSNGRVIGNTSANGGGVAVTATGQLNISDTGNIIGNIATTTGGGVIVQGAGQFNMSGSANIAGNRANGTGATAGGGGVALTAANGRFNMTGGTIGGARPFGLPDGEPNPYANIGNTGGGVLLNASPADNPHSMTGGSIVGNTALTNGGGVVMHANGTRFVLNGGDISGNTASGIAATAGGGGVFIAGAANLNSLFTFQSGTIYNNHAVMNGGGILATAFVHLAFLPADSYPQLSVNAAASFAGNTAGQGSSTPPINAVDATDIAVTASISGGYPHPLNNLDINFTGDDTDWFLLHSIIAGTDVANIVIHPTGASGVTHGISGSTFNLVISDPGDGSTIVTSTIPGAPATTDPHRINVLRTVIISAAPSANITLLMTATTPANIGRHFIVGANGNLTIGGGPLSGILTLDGGVPLTGNRGGVAVTSAAAGPAALTLAAGGAITYSRAATGGGVLVSGVAAQHSSFTMTGGSIADNTALGTGVGNSGGGVALHAANTAFTMSGGSITGNMVTSGNANAGGGGVALTSSSTGARFTMTGGRISDNEAQHGGGVLLHPNNVLYPHTISGGYIYDNLARGSGGGVALHGALTTLEMTGGTIGSSVNGENNHANTSGGGVSVVSTGVFNLSNGRIVGNTSVNGGGVVVTATGQFNLSGSASIVGNIATTSGGGVALVSSGQFNMSGNTSITGNHANGTAATAGGGGVALTANNARFNMTGGTIGGARPFGLPAGEPNPYANTGNTGGGVLLNASPFDNPHSITGGSIVGNIAATNGGGVVMHANGSQFVLDGGNIVDNTANGTAAATGGGGVFIAGIANLNSHFTFLSGTIHNNHAVMNGGGIFTAAAANMTYLPAGSYPQLSVNAAASFFGNTAGGGSFNPPGNATDTGITNIAATAQISGGFLHPLNNYDINFSTSDADWFLLNSIIMGLPAIDTIVIHPTGAPGVTHGISGSTYNLVISDPGGGSMITTIALPGTAVHNIVVSRPVTIQAALGADIIIRMPFPDAPNTPDEAPWITNAVTLSRHFVVNTGGALTLGGGPGSGNLILDGNADLLAIATRGGITVNFSSSLTVNEGATITNNRAAAGGGVSLVSMDAELTMTGGSISGNWSNTALVGQGGGGVALVSGGARFAMTGGTISNNIAANNGGGVALTVNDTQFAMSGGYILNNTANGTAIASGGGGIFIGPGADSFVDISSGSIRYNHAASMGGGIYTAEFMYMSPLPMGVYPQLTIDASVYFYGNTAGAGSHTPPANAAAASGIPETALISGGFDHPLNNYDINFMIISSDWFRINSIINATDAEIIVIHPTDTDVEPGLNGTTYNFIISDPGDGSTITTIHLDGGVSPHSINVSRPVTLQGGAGTDIVIRMPVPAGANTPGIAPWTTTQAALSRHFVVLEGGQLTIGGGAGTLTLDGNANLNNSARGGVLVSGDAGLVLQPGGVIYNNRNATGGGVGLFGFDATLHMAGGSIASNFATGTQGGGGVALITNGAAVTMSEGTITGNTAIANGGGVFMVAGDDASFTFTGGSIINNHANADGGGIFTPMFTYLSPLPTGNHFPQLTVSQPAAFSSNTAGNGGFVPPANATAYTEIAAVTSTGGLWHPLNNNDINFLPGDWVRLENIIATMPEAEQIIIYPAGSSITAGLDGTIYRFIITDPGNGSTITTVPIAGAPVADFHRINVLRPVAIEAAPGANIVMDMTAFATNTGVVNIGRHFVIGAGGGLTLDGAGTGTITLNGNQGSHTGIRGGVTISGANGHLTLNQGSAILNSRATNGGAVALGLNNTHLTISGGSISGNTATANGGGVHSVAGAATTITFNSGTIQNNHAGGDGGGIFTSTFMYQSPLPTPVTGVHFPQLTVYVNAVFANNTANGGAFHPPANWDDYTKIEAAASSGGFGHPLNNLDINFVSLSSDWRRLHAALTAADPDAIETIVIYPRHDISGMTEGMVGTTFNLVITDIGDGHTITTAPIAATHTIYVANRAVSIVAAPGHEIVLHMTATATQGTGRHFRANTNGVLTLGGVGYGTLILDGGRDIANITHTFTSARGGVLINPGTLVLHDGVVIRNSASNSGGGIEMRGGTAASPSTLEMYGGIITDNFATEWGGGGGVQVSVPNNHFNMRGGTISNNMAAHGGGVWTMEGIFNMYGGNIYNNTSGVGPGSGVTTRNHHGSGGGVMICCGGHFIMHGGTISDNIGRSGAGVHLSHPGTTDAIFTMRGGNIVGNRATVTHLNPAYLDAPGNPGSQLSIAPGIHSINSVFDMDGGGVFIMEGGLFVMEDPPVGSLTPININNNIADRHGGGVYWEVGGWRAYSEIDTGSGAVQVPRQGPVNFIGNEAAEDGGGIYISFNPLDMFGVWTVAENRANRGGGMFIHGDATPVGNTGTWHPDRGPGHLVMHDGLIYDNWSYTSGGGVYIYRDGAFFMHDGVIDNNSSAIFGGGVYVFNPGIHYTARFHVYGGEITNNTAIYGGGVYLMYRAHLFADNVTFSGNIAERMGGGIFTELVDYGYLLSGEDVPHDILYPRPPDPTEIFNAFDNIVTTDTVRFRDNVLDRRNSAIAAFHSPYNAFEMLTYDRPDGLGGFVPGNIRWAGWDTQPHYYLSAQRHPLNNYDINYVRPIYFYKADMEVYSFPATINNRPGAVFALDIWDEDIDDWVFYTSATSEANGRIALFVFHTGEFRLREVTPPTGWYILPPGHWYLEMAVEDFEVIPGVFDQLLYIVDPPPRPCEDNLEFFFVRLDRETAGTANCEGSQEERMRWHVGNAGPRSDIYVHKAGEDIIGTTPTQLAQIEDMLRQGAVFALYRYLGTGTPDETLVPAPGWVRTPFEYTSTGDPDYPIRLTFAFREDQDYSYYQLVELVPPVGYAVPFGQWRFRMDLIDLPQNLKTVSVRLIGDTSTPDMTQLVGEDGYVFAVGNRVNYALPMSGGFGSNYGAMNFAVAGFVFIAGGVGFAYWYTAKKKAMRKALPVASRGKLDS